MNAHTTIAFGALLIGACLCADAAVDDDTSTTATLTTLDGKTYENVEVVRQTPSALHIIHSAGAATLPLTSLPLDVRAKYGYDPRKAHAHQQRVDRARQGAPHIVVTSGKVGRIKTWMGKRYRYWFACGNKGKEVFRGRITVTLHSKAGTSSSDTWDIEKIPPGQYFHGYVDSSVSPDFRTHGDYAYSHFTWTSSNGALGRGTVTW